jgi:SM-20-related protein
MNSINNYFRLSIKGFESQFSVYNQGGFYKCHLDQHKETRHRQVSCCIYLNDCVDGGELVIYKKGSKTEVDKVIKPLSGSIVFFFSKDIYHEVKMVQNPRYSITTWFRDDETY